MSTDTFQGRLRMVRERLDAMAADAHTSAQQHANGDGVSYHAGQRDAYRGASDALRAVLDAPGFVDATVAGVGTSGSPLARAITKAHFLVEVATATVEAEGRPPLASMVIRLAAELAQAVLRLQRVLR